MVKQLLSPTAVAELTQVLEEAADAFVKNNINVFAKNQKRILNLEMEQRVEPDLSEAKSLEHLIEMCS